MPKAIHSPAQNDSFNFTPLFGSGQLKFTSTSKAVTPFAGVASLFAWLRQIGLPDTAGKFLPFVYTSPNAIPPVHILLAFMLSVILGGSRFAHSGWLRHDLGLRSLMGIKRFPGEDAIRAFFRRFTQAAVQAFWRPLWKWMLALLTTPGQDYTLDLDSTVFQRYGGQEGAAKGYNPGRPGRKSHHPLLAVLAEAPCILHAWLRSGNTGASRGVCAFLEARQLPYIIVAKLTTQIKRKLCGLTEWTGVDDHFEVGAFNAKLQGWDRERRIVVLRERVREDREAVGRKLIDVPGYTYRLWVTNRNGDAATLWRDYNGRATVEQRIEELKNDLHANGFCMQSFYATESAFLAVLFSFNLLSMYQAKVMSGKGYRQPATLRAAVFVCGAILGKKGRDIVMRFSSTGGGLDRHKELIEKALQIGNAITPLLGKPNPKPGGGKECEDNLSQGGCTI